MKMAFGKVEKNGVIIDEAKAQKMLRRVINTCKENNRTGDLSDPKMVEKIRKIIEEEAKCY
jgi:hypothetical protein